ncbi:MAG: hypothetical protein HY879_22630 [Deltaproteobacteria bacterium]|nr:hypothetical protein [Deltaproteobacteria bacterium]
MGSLLFAFLPESFFPLLMVFAGLALILGIISKRTALRFVGGLLLLLLLTPFIVPLFGALPWWIIILILIGLVWCLFRGVLSVLFGREATSHFVGQLMYAVFILPFRFIGYLLGGRRR